MNKPLLILEMANNHMGDLSHGKKIIYNFYNLTKKYKSKIDFAFKFQYRDNNTFIHESYKNSDQANVKRFENTFFNKKDWRSLLNYSKKYYNLICTPFDEKSVKRVFKENFKYLKIASCSATDWPLLEQVALCYKKKNKKIIASLAGLTINEISKIIAFFKNRKIDIRYLYCVGKYPTKKTDVNLSYFKFLKERYGSIVQGFSSHEEPNNHLTPIMAFGIGVQIFEKHVGIESKKYKLNKYSSTTKELKLWLDSLMVGLETWGSKNSRDKNIKNEIIQLNNFKRGVYLAKNIKKNVLLKKNDIKISFPALKNQVKASDISKYHKIFTRSNVFSNKPLLLKDVKIIDKRSKVEKIKEDIKSFLFNKKIVLPANCRLEISHHYGIDKFYQYGITMINVINNKYCKKLIIMLPGQKHPEQYHKIKEESFFILHGNVSLLLNNKRYYLKEGMLKTILPRTKHKFFTKKGCIIEELSSTSKSDDSFYIDKKINNNVDRKSYISLF